MKIFETKNYIKDFDKWFISYHWLISFFLFPVICICCANNGPKYNILIMCHDIQENGFYEECSATSVLLL